MLDELALSALNEVDYPMILLDRSLVVRSVNRAASWLLQSGTGMRCEGNRLVVPARDRGATLASAVMDATERGLRRWLSTDGMEPFSVVPAGPGLDVAWLIFGRPTLCQLLSIEGFARDRGLTASEAQVLRELCAGHSPESIATSRRVKLSTVRTQVQSLRAKIGVRDLRGVLLKLGALPPMMHRLPLAAS